MIYSGIQMFFSNEERLEYNKHFFILSFSCSYNILFIRSWRKGMSDSNIPRSAGEIKGQFPSQRCKLISEVIAKPQGQGEGLLLFELYHMFGVGLWVYVLHPPLRI